MNRKKNVPAYVPEKEDALLKDLFYEYADTAANIISDYVKEREDIRDLCQDVFVKIARHPESFRGKGAAEQKKLIIVYARNTAIDFLRKKGRRISEVPLFWEDGDGVEQEVELPSEEPTPEQVVIKKEEERALREYVDRLPEAQKRVILLRYFCDMDNRRIADILGISENVVSSRILRAIRNLQKMYGYKSNGKN